MVKKKPGSQGCGHLMVIGGGESRGNELDVLERFVDLAGGKRKRIAVLTAASTLHDEMWEVYDRAFGRLGVKQRFALEIHSRDDANDPKKSSEVLGAGGVFMTG